MENLKPLSLLSMFTSPLATFDSLREQPRWLFPLLFSSIVSAAANFYVIKRVGLVRLIKAASQSDYIIDPQAVIQSVLEYKHRILFFQASSVFVNVFVVTLVTAIVFWLLLSIFAHDIAFRKLLALVANANMLPIVARGCMIALTAAAIQDVNAFNLRNPLATNIAFFLRPSSPFMLRMLTSLDAVTLMNAVLLIMGLTRVCPKLSTKGASMMVFTCWALYLSATLFIPFFPL
jgi:hypothetical protein